METRKSPTPTVGNLPLGPHSPQHRGRKSIIPERQGILALAEPFKHTHTHTHTHRHTHPYLQPHLGLLKLHGQRGPPDVEKSREGGLGWLTGLKIRS